MVFHDFYLPPKNLRENSFSTSHEGLSNLQKLYEGDLVLDLDIGTNCKNWLVYKKSL